MHLRTNVDFKNNLLSLFVKVSQLSRGHRQARTQASKYLSLCEILRMKLQIVAVKKNCLAQHGCLMAEGGGVVTE